MKQRIYVDTSVIGGVLDQELKEWSKRLVKEFQAGERIAIISDLTLRELENAPAQVKAIPKLIPVQYREFVILDEEANDLANQYIGEGGIPGRFRLDAQHIAIATVVKADVLVSWNFKHIVNLRRIRLYNSINIKYGYPMIEIRTPREVLHDEEEI